MFTPAEETMVSSISGCEPRRKLMAANPEMLTGNLLAIGIGGIVSVGWTFLRPANFDFDITRNMEVKGHSAPVVEEVSPVTSPMDEKTGEEAEKTAAALVATSSKVEEAITAPEEIDFVGLHKAFRFASIAALILTVVFLLVIPLPLFFSQVGEYLLSLQGSLDDTLIFPFLPSQSLESKVSRRG